MKKVFTLLISAGIFFASTKAYSQVLVPGASDYYELGLLFSQYDYKGTSRIQALGGAQTSLGGDLSSTLSNPAGLGFYNRSEISLTPSVNTYSINSNYLNNSTEDLKTKFNVEHFGAALHKAFGKESGFISGTFGLSFTKTNEFNYQYNISGTNALNDIIDHFTQNANQINENNWPLFTNMAYNVYLIDEFQDTETNELFWDRTVLPYPSEEFPVDQYDEIISEGSQNQWSISYGANFEDILYLGAGIGIQSLRYDIEKYYEENYPGDDLISMSLYEYISTRGTGINGTVGFIVRPVKQLTIGASVISPTILSLSEQSEIIMESNFNNYEYDDNTVLNQVVDGEGEIFEFDYQITTPVRFNAGATVFLGKAGFLTGDIEYVDYSNISMDSEIDPLDDQDRIINAEYDKVLNYKLGAEFRLSNFRLRGGYALTKSPYVNNDLADRDVNKFSFGLGYRNPKFFVDLVSTYSMGNAIYSPYSFAPEDNENLQDIYVTPISDLDYNNLNIAFSLGFFF